MKDKSIDFELLRKRREKILKLRSESNEQQHIGLGYVITVDGKHYPVMACFPVGTAAGLPCAVPRYPAADLQPFNAAGDSGCEKRRGRFRCCNDPHRSRGGAEKS